MGVNTENLMERREYKYLLPQRLVPMVRAAARTVCELDSYAGPDGLYTIRSLYLDTPRLDLYNANHVEKGDRFKVRVRGYPNAGGKAPVFLEVKRRILDVNVKNRGAVPEARWAQILTRPGEMERAIQAGEIGAKSRAAVERFLALVHTYHLEPVVLVEYEREAYVSRVDNYARLTFDLNVRCQPKTTLDLGAEDHLWRSVDHSARYPCQEPLTLLEMKFGGKAPRWMMEMARKLELTRFSFSKYGYSIYAQNTLPGLHEPARHLGMSR